MRIKTLSMLPFLLLLSACSTQPIAQQTKVTFIAVPKTLLVKGVVVPVKDPTVAGLAEAYVDNTIQLGIVNDRIEKIEQWSNQQQQLHEQGNMDK